MKKQLTFMLVPMYWAATAFAQENAKITIEITKEIDGEKKTFKGEYESVGQMKANPGSNI